MTEQKLDYFIDEDGWVTCIYFNGGYTDYVKNLIKCLDRIEKKWKLCCICIDDVASKFCEENNIPYIKFEINSGINSFCKWGEDNYKKIVFKKFDSLLFVLENPRVKYCVYLDSDIFVFKDFIPYLKNNVFNYDALFQCDETDGKNKICSRNDCSNVCTGFMVLKNCSSIKEVLNYNNKSVNKSCSGDQEYINNRSLMNQIKKMALDRNLFPNGTFLSNISKEAYIIHYNYLIGHLKKDKMKENNHWLL